MSETVYIGLGSNIGDGERQIRKSLRLIASVRGVTVQRVSSFYLSEPVGGPAQPWYHNAVVGLQTTLAPAELLDALQRIERTRGRERGERNAPRTIDLDILLFGGRIIHSDRLTVPHPRMCDRRFVLEPLAEIARSAVHPARGETIEALLSLLGDRHAVIRKGALHEHG